MFPYTRFFLFSLLIKNSERQANDRRLFYAAIFEFIEKGSKMLIFCSFFSCFSNSYHIHFFCTSHLIQNSLLIRKKVEILFKG